MRRCVRRHYTHNRAGIHTAVAATPRSRPRTTRNPHGSIATAFTATATTPNASYRHAHIVPMSLATVPCATMPRATCHRHTKTRRFYNFLYAFIPIIRLVSYLSPCLALLGRRLSICHVLHCVQHVAVGRRPNVRNGGNAGAQRLHLRPLFLGIELITVPPHIQQLRRGRLSGQKPI